MIAMKEDLVCILNTVALFLEHQNFIETCVVFREECKSRGFNNMTNGLPYRCSSRTDNDLHPKGQNEVSVKENSHVTNSKNPLQEDELESGQITYTFEKEEGKEIFSSSRGTDKTEILENIESCASLADYHYLKEKFLELQNQYSFLMGELEEKTRSLDHTIYLLEQKHRTFREENNLRVAPMKKCCSSTESKAQVPLRCCRSCETVGSNDLSKSEIVELTCNDKSSSMEILTSTVPLLNAEEMCCFRKTKLELIKKDDTLICCSKKRQNYTLSSQKSTRNSSSFMNQSQSTSIDTKPTDPNMNIENCGTSIVELNRNEIPPRDSMDEVNFLFTRRKCHQTHSAPNGSIENCTNEQNFDHERTHTCFSMPLSAKKNRPYDNNCELDFSKVKQDLAYGQTELRLLILQALRWRLTRSSYAGRRFIITSYVENDLLNLQSKNTILDALFQKGTDEEIREAVSRLTNTIVSLKQGRDYICSSKEVLRTSLMSAVRHQLERCEKVSICFEMLIVTLQKLSIRKEQRKLMIQQGLLQSISKMLINRRNELSAYCLEYSFALFMNLCLENEAKLECAEDPVSIIKVFSCLLYEVQVNYLPYVTGALYSILSEKSVEKEAVRQQLDVLIFKQMKNTSDKYLSKQLEFIIRARFRGEGASFTCNENEPSEDIDILEPEIDENDNILGLVQGENLLVMYEQVDESAGETNNYRTSIQDEIHHETQENTSQTESEKKITTIEEGTNKEMMNNTPQKIETSRIKFDAEISTSSENLDTIQKIIPVGSLVQYAQTFRPDVLPQTLGVCSCLGRAKYNCGCYEAIKRSIEEDEQLLGIMTTDTETNLSEKGRNSNQLRVFAPESSANAKHEVSSPFMRRGTSKKS